MDKLQGVALYFPSAWWDGPLTGLCKKDGKLYWFACADEVAEERIYGLYKLTEKELSYQEETHRRFEEYVGTHQCYHLPKGLRAQKPRELHSRFYRQKNLILDRERQAGYLDPARLVGYFTSFENRF